MISDDRGAASDDAAALDKAGRATTWKVLVIARGRRYRSTPAGDNAGGEAEVDDALKWLNENNDADADAVRKRQQAFDAIVHPVIASCCEVQKPEDDDEVKTDDPWWTRQRVTSGSSVIEHNLLGRRVTTGASSTFGPEGGDPVAR